MTFEGLLIEYCISAIHVCSCVLVSLLNTHWSCGSLTRVPSSPSPSSPLSLSLSSVSVSLPGNRFVPFALPHPWDSQEEPSCSVILKYPCFLPKDILNNYSSLVCFLKQVYRHTAFREARGPWESGGEVYSCWELTVPAWSIADGGGEPTTAPFISQTKWLIPVFLSPENSDEQPVLFI